MAGIDVNIAHHESKKAKALLEAAKKAVEIAIEQREVIAARWLRKRQNVYTLPYSGQIIEV